VLPWQNHLQDLYKIFQLGLGSGLERDQRAQLAVVNLVGRLERGLKRHKAAISSAWRWTVAWSDVG
jgi:hypothetical protein